LQFATIFDATELEILQTNLAAMMNDIQQYEQALDSSHHGRPALTE
jgi:hypothetical protein